MADNKLSAQVTIDTKQAVTSLAGLNKSVKGSAEVLQKLKPAAASGGAALTSLSRIAQDAPFGFIAIQNNVTEAVASFGALKQSTGSTSLALKALASSLAGPGGVLLAFSLITSGVTALVQKYGSLGNAMDVLLGHTKALTDEQKKYAEEQHKTAVSIQTQRIETEQLVKVARGDIGSKGEQIAALEQLNKAIPDYIGVLTESNLKTAEGAKIIDTYTRALEKQATAELLVGRAAELNVRNIDAQNKIRRELPGLLAEEIRLTKELASQRRIESKVVGGSGLGVGSGGGSAQVEDALFGAKAKIAATLKEFSDGRAAINQELKQIRDDIDANTVVLDTSQDAKVSKAAVTKIKESIEQGLEADNKIRFTPEITVLQSGIEIADGLKKLNTFVQQSIDTTAATKTFVFRPKVIVKPEAKEDELEKELEKIGENFNRALAGLAVTAGIGFAETLGAALANGLDTTGLANLFSQFLSTLGKIMVEAGTAALLAKKALATIIANPVGAIAAGLGLIAIASFAKNKLSATKFAEGGIVTGPTLGMVGEAGQPEVILPLSKINQFLSGEGQGNGGALTLSVSGDVFTFGLARNARKQSRLY